jgi:hypothetical protein
VGPQFLVLALLMRLTPEVWNWSRLARACISSDSLIALTRVPAQPRPHRHTRRLASPLQELLFLLLIGRHRDGFCARTSLSGTITLLEIPLLGPPTAGALKGVDGLQLQLHVPLHLLDTPGAGASGGELSRRRQAQSHRAREHKLKL